MEQPSEPAALNGDTKSVPRSASRSSPEVNASDPAPVEDASIGSGEDQDHDKASASTTNNHASGTATPPYWQHSNSSTLQRTISTASEASLSNIRPTLIQLEDHSDEYHEVGRACWAKHVSIDDYVVVGGGAIAGTYVVWNCSVETLKGAPFTIRKRYSEFDDLRQNLVRAFPQSEASIPELPRKSVISRFRPRFLEQRKAGLSHFLNCVLLNPEFSGSPLVKDFVFS